MEKVKPDVLNRQRSVIVLIHGFGDEVSDEMQTLTDHFRNSKYNVITPDLYDPKNPQDYDYKKWLARIDKVLDDVQDKDIYLIGFSMGGVIAAHFATIYPVKKLVLLAPAYKYISIKGGLTALKKFFNKGKEPFLKLPRSFYRGFVSIVRNLKSSAKNLNTPVLIIHGTHDTVIPFQASTNIIKKIPTQNKKLILIENASHLLLKEEPSKSKVVALVDQFF